MEKKSCFEAIASVVARASETKSDYRVDEVKYSVLKGLSLAIDRVAEEFGIGDVRAVADSLTTRLTISIECTDLEVHYGISHEFYRVIELVDSFSFAWESPDTIRIDFHIDDMWVLEYE